MAVSFARALTFSCSKSLVNAYCLILFVLDRESIEHDDTVKPDTTEDQSPKIPLKIPDVINSKKQAAVRKDKKKQQEKLRTLGTMDYSPLPIDKHEPEFVSCVTQQLQ